MKIIQVLFLAFCQLTAVPFVVVLTAYSLAPHTTLSPSVNITVAYKTPR